VEETTRNDLGIRSLGTHLQPSPGVGSYLGIASSIISFRQHLLQLGPLYSIVHPRLMQFTGLYTKSVQYLIFFFVLFSN